MEFQNFLYDANNIWIEGFYECSNTFLSNLLFLTIILRPNWLGSWDIRVQLCDKSASGVKRTKPSSNRKMRSCLRDLANRRSQTCKYLSRPFPIAYLRNLMNRIQWISRESLTRWFIVASRPTCEIPAQSLRLLERPRYGPNYEFLLSNAAREFCLVPGAFTYNPDLFLPCFVQFYRRYIP